MVYVIAEARAFQFRIEIGLVPRLFQFSIDPEHHCVFFEWLWLLTCRRWHLLDVQLSQDRFPELHVMAGCQIKTDAGQDDIGLITTLAVTIGTVLI